MSDDPGSAEAPAKPKKKAGLLIILVLALLFGGGAFYGVYSGMIPLPFGGDEAPAAEPAIADQEAPPFAERDRSGPAPAVAYIPLDEMVISLGPRATARHLKLRLSIEVSADAEQAVVQVTPRIMDVLNTFLRAVDERDVELPRAMMRLRAQMLRRVQLVTPEGAVRDLLIQEFILN